jgi:(1->4)-alpha-D-glucan 1-alpha-D-glucosylmutase
VRLNNETAPDGNDRTILLQALLGAWPLELLDGHDEAAATAFRERMEGYVTKALREAKRHTSWVNVNDSYENATLGLVRGLLDGNGSTLDPLRPLARRLSHLGMLNGLSRTILKCTLPGVPDTYRGTEFWDFSLVDPDNRRPVDYAALAQGLEDDAPAEALLQSWQDGRIKQRVLTRLIADRAEAPLLYSEGEYRALAATGSKARHALAFLRNRADQRLLVVVPRLIAAFTEPNSLPLGPKVWGDTSLPLPPGRWRNVLTDAEIETSDRPHPVGELFSALPIAVLRTLP